MSAIIFGGRMISGRTAEMSILSAIFLKLYSGEILSDLAEVLEGLRKDFADLERLADCAVIPCSSSPIEYARRRDNRNILAERFRGLSARYRAKMYRLRFSPCCHKAGGVMIRKKGRLVRRKR